MKNEIKEYSTLETAIRIGVSARRIRQLYQSGEIEGNMRGRDLFITETGIEQAKARRTKAGRPKNDERRQAA
jgi:hypothetical protein